VVIVTIHSGRSLSKLWVSCKLNVHALLESWEGLLPLLMNWISHGLLVSVRFSVERIKLFLLHVSFQIYYWLQLIRHGGHSDLYHLGSNLMHDRRFSNHHRDPIEILHVRALHWTESSFSHPGEIMRTSCRLRASLY